MICKAELSPVELQSLEWVIQFWNALRVCDDPGATTWEVLDSLEKEVAECLYGSEPVAVDTVKSLTAQAALLISGYSS